MRLFLISLSLVCLTLSAQEVKTTKIEGDAKEAISPPLGPPPPPASDANAVPTAVEKTNDNSTTATAEKNSTTKTVSAAPTNKPPVKPISSKKFDHGMTKETRKKLGREESSFSIARYIITMAVVLCLLALVLYLLKRFAGKIGAVGYGSLNVVQRLQLDNKNSLILVRHHEDEVLLAVGPNGTTLISRSAALEGTDDDLNDGKEPPLETRSVSQNTSLMSKLIGGFSATQRGTKP